MNIIEIFRNNKLGDLRVTTTEAVYPYFCLPDLCTALDITNSINVKGRLNEKGVCTMDTLT
jgi:prophage antirepressor-like protein